MIRGLYSAGLGMITERNVQNVIAHNMANVATPGYREIQASVQPYGGSGVTNRSTGVFLGGMNFGSIIAQTETSFAPGTMEPTGRNLDVAIRENDAFFAVQGEDGTTYYTRRGAFQLDADRRLVDADGRPVLGVRGTIRVNNPDDVTIDAWGNVRDGQRVVDQLRLYRFADPRRLQRIDGTLFAATEESGQPTVFGGDDRAQFVPRTLEMANVDPTKVTIEMMNVLKRYEANMQMLRTADQTLGRAVNEIARLS